jgi:hypothetical protein
VEVNVRKIILWLSIAAAIVAWTGMQSTVTAEPKQKQPACSTLKDEAACTARDDCQWSTTSKGKSSCKRKSSSSKK